MSIDHKIPNDKKDYFFTGYNQRLLNDIWNRVCKTTSLYHELDGYSFEHFQSIMIESTVWIVFSFGFVRMLPLEPGHYARAHGYFWSPDVVRHKDVIREAIKRTMKTFLLRRLEIVVPTILTGLNKFVKTIGFEKEGTLRLFYRLQDNELIDGTIYAIILKEEKHG